MTEHCQHQGNRIWNLECGVLLDYFGISTTAWNDLHLRRTLKACTCFARSVMRNTTLYFSTYTFVRSIFDLLRLDLLT
jgi:hypothetical protein